MERQKLYFYNMKQCNFYMEHGLKACGCGIHPKTLNTWIAFYKDETLEVYLLWLEKCEIHKKLLLKENEENGWKK